MKHAIAAVPQPVAEPKPKRERPEQREAEARLLKFMRGLFRTFSGEPTWMQRAELRRDAHRAVDRYFDAKVAGK